MIIIDTQEKMDKLLPESGSYSISDLYHPTKSFHNIMFKNINFDSDLLISFFSATDSFSSVILKDCTFRSESPREVELYASSSILIDSCVFNNVELGLRNDTSYPKIILNSVISDEGITISPNNGGVRVSNCESTKMFLGYDNKYPTIIIGSKITELCFIKGRNSEINNNNNLLIRNSKIEYILLDIYDSSIRDISNGGITYNSLFNNPDITELELNCYVSGVDFSGVDFSNVTISDRNGRFKRCNFSEADLSGLSITEESDAVSFDVIFIQCKGMDTVNIPRNMKFINSGDEEYLLVFSEYYDG